MTAVLERARTISIPKGWKPNFAFPDSPQKFVNMLIARARLTLAVSEARFQIDMAKKNGATEEQISQIKRAAIADRINALK